MFKIFIVSLYVMVGTGVFISVQTRTAIRCPEENMSRAVLYGVAWPMLLGYKLLDGNLRNIPNCKVMGLEGNIGK